MWPFNWKLFSSTFKRYPLFFNILRNEVWHFSWNLIFATPGSYRVKRRSYRCSFHVYNYCESIISSILLDFYFNKSLSINAQLSTYFGELWHLLQKLLNLRLLITKVFLKKETNLISRQMWLWSNRTPGRYGVLGCATKNIQG